MHSKKMTALQFLALVLLVSPCFSQERCNIFRPTMQEDAIGPEVVNEVLYRLECCGMFEDDHSFMRRLAYVETKDGTAEEETTGIWHISEGLLTKINNSIGEYNELTKNISERFNISIIQAVSNRQNLRHPLVSAVVARFYLHYVTVKSSQQIPPAEDVTGQAMFWGMHFRMSTESAITDHFTSRVLELKG